MCLFIPTRAHVCTHTQLFLTDFIFLHMTNGKSRTIWFLGESVSSHLLGTLLNAIESCTAWMCVTGGLWALVTFPQDGHVNCSLRSSLVGLPNASCIWILPPLIGAVTLGKLKNLADSEMEIILTFQIVRIGDNCNKMLNQILGAC